MALRRRTVSTSLSLPTEVNELPSEFHNQCALWFGRKSWGKTTLISQYPEALVMLLEPGRRNLVIKQVPKKGEVITWELIQEYVALFMESDYQQLCIDTLDRYYAACLKHVTSEMSGGSFDDPQRDDNKDNRPGYYISSQKVFEESLEAIQSAGKTWILTSHDKKVQTKHPITGEKEERIEPSCSPSAWKIAQSMCDYVFHVEFLNKDRVVCVRDLENIALAACGRDDVFLNPDSTPISRFVVPNVASEVYDTVLKAYDNKLEDLTFVPPPKELPKAKQTKTSTNGKHAAATAKRTTSLPSRK